MKQTITARSTRRRRVQIAGWVHPTVKQELERIAKAEHLSSSQLVAVFVEQGLRLKLHEQNETLLYPTIRQAVHEELTTFGNRVIYFLTHIALSAEQARILLAYVLQWVLRLSVLLLKLPEKPEDIRERIIDLSRRQARENLTIKKDYIHSMIEEWEGAPLANRKDGNKQGA